MVFFDLFGDLLSTTKQREANSRASGNNNSMFLLKPVFYSRKKEIAKLYKIFSPRIDLFGFASFFCRNQIAIGLAIYPRPLLVEPPSIIIYHAFWF
jgi:hypothetical protein